MKTAPQIMTSLIIHQSLVLNKHNRPLLPQKDRRQLEIPILLGKIGCARHSKCARHSSSSGGRQLLSTEEPTAGVHMPPRTYICISTDIGRTYIPAQEQACVCTHGKQTRSSLLNASLLIQQRTHLTFVYLQEKYRCVSQKITDKSELPAIHQTCAI